MSKAVLVLTNTMDMGADVVLQHIRRSAVRGYRFNTDGFPSETRITLGKSTDQVSGYINLPECNNVGIETIQSIWYRRPRPSIQRLQHEGLAKFVREESAAALWSFYTTSDVYWMNQPLIASALLEHNKLYQMQIAAQLGIAVPNTIITNDPNDLIAFCQQNGGTIAIKLLKGNLFRKEGEDLPFLIYTQKVSEADLAKRKDELEVAPIFAQEYIEKAFELRVTFVAGTFFACAIDSQSSEQTRVDWRRYDFTKVTHTQYELPESVQSALARLMSYWGLNFGAIDMICTPDGRFVFLEVNSAGEWLWIEQLTNMPISKAIADALINADSSRSILEGLTLLPLTE
jgi:glutathione synthase/RimK-type ligase-like ATP-grasp enzyme